MHTYELQGFQWDVRGWLLRAIPYTDPEAAAPRGPGVPQGVNNFRVQYTAGYATVPESSRSVRRVRWRRSTSRRSATRPWRASDHRLVEPGLGRQGRHARERAGPPGPLPPAHGQHQQGERWRSATPPATSTGPANAPPAPADVSGVPILFEPDWVASHLAACQGGDHVRPLDAHRPHAADHGRARRLPGLQRHPRPGQLGRGLRHDLHPNGAIGNAWAVVYVERTS